MQTNIRHGGGGTLNKNPLKKIKKMNIIIFALVGISLFSLTTFTSYALFTNETEGQNTLSLTVSTAGKISIRIFAQDTGTEVGTLSNHQNIIKFNVKDGYVYEDNSLSCTTDGEATYNKATNILTINNATKNGTCEISYVAGYQKLYDMIVSEPLNENNGLFATDQTNTWELSYYYHGNVDNNYVKLTEKTGDALYRIVRTNEDGSIRLIREEGINNNTTYYFNADDYHDYIYIYYSQATKENGIMKILNDWYDSAISTSTFASKVVNSSYCEQAKITWHTNTTPIVGNVTMSTEVSAYTPNLRHQKDANDKGPINSKVGLLTLDEAIMAGIPIYGSNQSSQQNVYLKNSSKWWTMSPAGYNSSSLTGVWTVNVGGHLAKSNTYSDKCLIRPVISLDKNVQVKSGNGTITNPYTIL